jgi:hypothetical protein
MGKKIEKNFFGLKGMYKKDTIDLEKQLVWFNHFVDYIGNADNNMYNNACEYADECEESI